MVDRAGPDGSPHFYLQYLGLSLTSIDHAWSALVDFLLLLARLGQAPHFCWLGQSIHFGVISDGVCLLRQGPSDLSKIVRIPASSTSRLSDCRAKDAG